MKREDISAEAWRGAVSSYIAHQRAMEKRCHPSDGISRRRYANKAAAAFEICEEAKRAQAILNKVED